MYHSTIVTSLSLLTLSSLTAASSDHLRCIATNAFATAFLPRPLVSSFCSAWLQTPYEAVISTSSESTLPSHYDLTLPSGGIAEMMSVPTASGSNVWIGRPACSTLPKFERVRSRDRQNTGRMASMLDYACACLEPSALATTTTSKSADTMPIAKAVIEGRRLNGTTAVTMNRLPPSTKALPHSSSTSKVALVTVHESYQHKVNVPRRADLSNQTFTRGWKMSPRLDSRLRLNLAFDAIRSPHFRSGL